MSHRGLTECSDNLEGRDGEGDGREAQERGGMCMPVGDAWQKPAQYCKAIILQLKKM